MSVLPNGYAYQRAQAAAGRPWRPGPSWEARLSVCPARTPSGGVRDLCVVQVFLCYSVIRGGRGNRSRVPSSSSLEGEWMESPAGF